MKVSLIAAVARNQAIGKDNDLLWNLPDDMRFFRDTTRGHAVIMGRKNYESIPPKFRPLPGRQNIIITRQKDFMADGCGIAHSLDEAIEIARRSGEAEVFIVGGAMIYRLALEQKVCDTMYITWVQGEFEADAFFPLVDFSEWQPTEIQMHPKDGKHDFSFVIKRYDKIPD